MGKTASNTVSTRHAKILLFWKIVEYTGLVAYILIIPKSMGPETYGKFAVLMAAIGILWMFSSLGIQSIFGRFISEFESNNQRKKSQELFTQFFLLRFILSLVLIALLFYFFKRNLPDLSTNDFTLSSIIFLLGTLSISNSILFYALNSTGKWVFRESTSRLLLVIFIILSDDFSINNALAIMTFLEIMYFCLLSFWGRHLFIFHRYGIKISYLIPYLKFGLMFFMSNLLMLIVWRSGEILILEMSNSSTAEIAYFNLANAIVMAFSSLLAQLFVFVIPSITSFHVVGDDDSKDLWLILTLKYTLFIAFSILLVTLCLSNIVIVSILGIEFFPVVINLHILILCLVPISIVKMSTSMAIVNKKTVDNLYIGLITFFAFIISAILLIPKYNAIGASISVLISSYTGACFSYYKFKLGKYFNTGRIWELLFSGIIATLSIFVTPYTIWIDIIVAISLFLLLLSVLKVITFNEIRSLLALISRR